MINPKNNGWLRSYRLNTELHGLSPIMPTVLVSGTLVGQGVVLDNVAFDSLIARLVDRMSEKRPDLVTQNFALFKNKECTEECALTDLVSSLGMSNNVYRVYIRPVPIAGKYTH